MFSRAAFYSESLLVSELDFLEAIPDKANVGHVKVNIFVCVQICRDYGIHWVYLQFIYG